MSRHPSRERQSPGSREADGRSEAGPSCTFGQVACNVLGLPANSLLSAGQKGTYISTKDFLQGLDKILPRPPAEMPPPPKRYRDAEFDKVARFCKMYNHDAWGLRPRTFVILYMIGCIEALDGFVAQSLSDFALPYTKENLPRAIRGTKARAQFLDYQNYVLTAHAADLEKDGRSHQNVEGSADEFFWTVRDLGSGGFGIVDHVTSKLSLSHYARKRIPRGRSFKRDREAMRIFENELKTLKALQHRHLVKLIGSYTDRTFVGLIMNPVADMNLATYLSATADLEDRKNCLRRFFGCLATAVDYLHSQKVRHKDIKPENILVKDRSVLLTDFGTSHNWADDSKSSTSGTIGGFTRRYCAPEVAASASRNPASDIWSLGCVFIEMSTVLMNRTIQELRKFYEENGTKGHYVRDNLPGTDLWMEQLKSSASIKEDHQTLDLGRTMCTFDPMGRPTASELVSEILDLKGPPAYFGFCCDRDNDTRLTTESQEPGNHLLEGIQTRSKMLPETIVSPAQQEKTEIEVQSWPLQLPASSYQGPSVEEVTDGVTLRVLYPEADSLVDKLDSIEEDEVEAPQSNSDTGGVPEGAGRTTSPADKTNVSLQRQFLFGRWPTRSLRHLDYSNLICLWPSCITAATEPEVFFDGIEALQLHYRSDHGVHEFSWTRLVQKSADLFASDLDPDSYQPLLQEISEVEPRAPGTCKKAVHLPDIWTPPPTDIYSESRERAVAATRSRSRKPVARDNIGNKSDVKGNDVVPDGRPQLDRGSSSTSAKANDSADVKEVRFSMLPEPIRPEPVRNVHDIMRAMDSETYENTAEVLEEPEVDFSRHSPESSSAAGATSNQRDPLIPKASLVPSFSLASRNRFTRREIETLLPSAFDRLWSFVPPPLFVYGRLMFPSVLRATAEKFATAEGVYSESLQRRLRTGPSDWAKANLSLQHAVERMTPAVLRGYDRWKVKRSWAATIEQTALTPEILRRLSSPPNDDAVVPSGEVRGFLIFGLSAEALSCLDYDIEKDSTGIHFSEVFDRKNVEVQTTLKEGGDMTLSAVTYTWKGRLSSLRSQWDINRFVRSKTFNRLSTRYKGGDIYVEEERNLASAMGITYILAGDRLCNAILQGDKDKILELLDDGYDVNAPCTTYGCALQAAASKGDDEVVRLLLDRDADVNARGGHYHRPLIAATVQGHENVARTLLKNGADVLSDGGQYTSAIYQAVDFSDEALTLLLLEKGAWLSRDYRELLDVAAERGNREIIRMLQEYDVKMLHARPAIAERPSRLEAARGSTASTRVSHRRSNTDQRVAVKPLHVVRAVGIQALLLKGTKGKWTGIKGVRLMKAAIRAGIDPSIVDSARPFLGSYQRALDYLTTAVVQMNEERIGAGTSTSRPTGQIEDGSGSSGATYLGGADLRPGQSQSSVARSRRPLPDQDRPHRASTSSIHNDEVICMTCNGRGGRRGTERQCPYCAGSGQETFRKGSGSRGGYISRCRSCNGKGVVFTERDRCHACDGGSEFEQGRVSAPASVPPHSPAPPPATLRRPGSASLQSQESIPDSPPPVYTSRVNSPRHG